MATIQKINSDFSLTKKVNDWIGNPDWKEGYYDVQSGVSFDQIMSSSNFGSLWYFLSASIDNTGVGGEIYSKTSNYIKNIVDADTCELRSLRSLAKELAIKDSDFYDLNFPSEIEKMINIFSISSSRVTNENVVLTPESLYSLNNATSASVTGVMNGYVLSGFENSGIVQSISSNFYTTDDNKYLEYIRESFTVTLSAFATMIPNVSMEVRKDTEDIEDMKIDFGISKTFHANQIVDKIQFGDDKLENYDDAEQTVLQKEIDNRVAIYDNGDRTTKYRLNKEAKVKQYISFIENLVNGSNVNYSINADGKMYLGETFTTLTYSSSTSDYMIKYSADVLANMCVNLTYFRENIKRTAQKYALIGTAKLIQVSVSEYLFKYWTDPVYWRFKNLSGQTVVAGVPVSAIPTINGDPELSGIIGNIKVIEYNDNTEYFNIGQTDNELGVNSRFWEGENLLLAQKLSDHTSDDVMQFYKNIGLVGTDEEILSYVDSLYNMGATSGSVLTTSYPLSSAPLSSLFYMYQKYSGIDGLTGSLSANNCIFAPSNIKNKKYSSVAQIPFLYNLVEKTYNLVLSKTFTNTAIYSSDVESQRVTDRYNSYGFPINSWKAGYDELAGYTTYYEYSNNLNIRNVESPYVDVDGPWIPDALSSFITNTSSYVNSFISGRNVFYKDIDLNSYDKSKISSQLNAYSGEIYSLSASKIYQYGCDLFGNQYTLFKDSDDFDLSGKLWMRIKDHPLSFPLLSGTGLSANAFVYSQINIEDTGINQYLNTNSVYDFGLFDNMMWVFCGNSSISGDVYLFEITAGRDFTQDNRLVFYGKSGYDEFNKFIKNSNNKYIGVYKNNNKITLATVKKSGNDYVVSGSSGYKAIIDFNTYSSSDIDFDTKTVYLKFPEYKPLDNHNQWKLATGDEKVSIGYEFLAPSATMISNYGTEASGVFNYNENFCLDKHFENGVSVVNFEFQDNSLYQKGDAINYFKYTDLTYVGLNAGPLSTNFIIDDNTWKNFQFMGNDGTSAMMYLNGYGPTNIYSVAGNLVIRNGTGIQPWVSMINPWLSGGFNWTNNYGDFITLSEVGQTAEINSSTIDGSSYKIYVQYLGNGCQKFRMKITQPTNFVWEDNRQRYFDEVFDDEDYKQILEDGSRIIVPTTSGIITSPTDNVYVFNWEDNTQRYFDENDPLNDYIQDVDK